MNDSITHLPPGEPAAPGLTLPALRLLLTMIKREARETVAMIGTDATAEAIDARVRALDDLTRAVLSGALDSPPVEF